MITDISTSTRYTIKDSKENLLKELNRIYSSTNHNHNIPVTEFKWGLTLDEENLMLRKWWKSDVGSHEIIYQGVICIQ